MNFEFDNFKTSVVITPTPERQYDALHSKIDMTHPLIALLLDVFELNIHNRK